MQKQFISGLIMVLFSSLATANTASLALTTSANDEIVLPITLNNQANASIKTESNLIPNSAQNIAPQEAVVFNLKLPAKDDIKRIRYSNDIFGCDFYITVRVEDRSPAQGGPLPVAFLAAIPISAGSTCNVTTVGGVNHLSVSFMKMNQPF